MSFSTGTEPVRAPFSYGWFKPETSDGGSITGNLRRRNKFRMRESSRSVEFHIVQTAVMAPLTNENAYTTPIALEAATDKETQAKLDAETNRSTLQTLQTMSADPLTEREWEWEMDVQLWANERVPRDMGWFKVIEKGNASIVSGALSGGTGYQTSSISHSGRPVSSPRFIGPATATSSGELAGDWKPPAERRSVRFVKGTHFEDLVNEGDIFSSNDDFTAPNAEPIQSRTFSRTRQTEATVMIENTQYAMTVVVTQTAHPVRRDQRVTLPSGTITLHAEDRVKLNSTPFFRSIEKNPQVRMMISTEGGMITKSSATFLDGKVIKTSADDITLYNGDGNYGLFKVQEYCSLELSEGQKFLTRDSSEPGPSGTRAARHVNDSIFLGS